MKGNQMILVSKFVRAKITLLYKLCLMSYWRVPDCTCSSAVPTVKAKQVFLHLVEGKIFALDVKPSVCEGKERETLMLLNLISIMPKNAMYKAQKSIKFISQYW